jgi:Stress responsive A/B Barrel Domain
MINHVVLMKFKPDVNDDAIDALEKSLDDLPNKIVEIQTYEFGRDRVHSEKSYDFALVSLFANLEAMKRYQEHPAHLKVLQKIKTLSENIIVVDFEGTDAGSIKKDEEGAILSRLGRA